jgi:hypothetical protein
MALTYVVREVGADRAGRVSAGANYTYTRRWEIDVVGDANAALVGSIKVREAFLAQTSIDVGTHYQLGTTGDAWYERDLTAFAKSFNIRCISDDRCTWEVVVDYEEYDPDEWLPNPLDRAALRDWGEVSTEAVADRGWNSDGTQGGAIINSAGDYFDPPVLRDLTRPTLTIVRNEAIATLSTYPVWDPVGAAAYRDTINSATWLTYPQYTVKCRSITAREAWSSKIPNGLGGYGAKYAIVTYSFEINPDTWRAYPLDQGLRRLDTGVRKQIIVDGSPATSPVLLNGSGAVLSVGGTPVYGSHLLYRPRAFSAFGFTF